jgi:anti-sigma B factor antagonist
MAAKHQLLDIEEIGDITVVRFLDKKLLGEDHCRKIGDQLDALVEKAGRTKIVLDFGNVVYMGSEAFGELIDMCKKVQAAHANLRLCNIRPEIYEVFEVTYLRDFFTIKSTLEDAIEEFNTLHATE